MKILWLMILGHMVAEYTLQGWLADGKQKKWWDKQCGGIVFNKYRFDYIAALVCHGIYWSVVAFLPLYATEHWAQIILPNALAHAVIDDFKANKGCLNLWQDQLLHLVQIVVAYIILV